MKKDNFLEREISGADSGTSGDTEEYQFVGFIIDDQEFAVDIKQIREIIRGVKITKLPNSPDFVEGVVNLRGSVMPVIDLRKRFCLRPNKSHDDGRVIVAELEQGMVGFIVDSVTEVRRVTNEIIEPPPERAVKFDSHYVSGIAKLKDVLLIVLDLERVLTLDEMEAVPQLEQAAAAQTA